jgi:hypothetical protein
MKWMEGTGWCQILVPVPTLHWKMRWVQHRELSRTAKLTLFTPYYFRVSSHIYCTFIIHRYFIRENEIGWIRGIYGGEKRYIQDFGGKT